MHNRAPHGRIGLISLAAMFAATLAACHSDSSNTAPAVATTITANTGSDAQTGTVGAALPQAISVHVADQNNNAIANATVTWTVATGGGSVSAPTSTTNATGDATVTWTLGNTAGPNTLTAALAGGASVTLHATGTAAAAATATKTSGDAQSIPAGSASQPLVVTVTDQFNNPVANVAVVWATVSGATLSATSTTTDATGKASITITAATAPGLNLITATAGSLPAVTFTVTGM